MKRIISIFLAITMLFSITTGLDLTVHAAELSGTCGDNITWEIDAETGVLTISGTGAIKDYSTSDTSTSPFYHNDYIKTAVIGEGITSIGSHAFFYCTTLTNVTLPSTLEVIGDGAFSYAKKLTEIIIPEGVKTIENNAFQNCEKLTKAVIPSTVTTMSYQIFWNCYLLKNANLPDGITSIPGGMFKNCYELESISIPDSVKEIKHDAFYNCYKLANVTLPENLEILYDYAFYNCDTITEVTIPSSVKSIGDYVFAECDTITEVTIPSSVKSIGDYVFAGCDNLDTVVLPDDITSIPEGMFKSCYELESMSIPDSVKEIKSYAFYYCYKLPNVTLPENLESLGSYAFYNCNTITEVPIPSSTKSIGDYVFADCDILRTVVLPDDITSIHEGMFKNCYELESISIPDSVKEIKHDAFSNCYKLTNVTLPENLEILYDYAFYNCNTITEVTIPSSIKSIGDRVFAECDKLYTVVLPDNLTYISSYMFYNCSNLTNINIPSALTTIYNYAFYNCESLKEFTFPEGLTYLGESAFYSCGGIDKVVLPSTLTSIPQRAFGEMTQCDDLYIPDSITEISYSAFSSTYFENTYYGGNADQWAKISFGTPTSNPLYNGDNLYFNNELATDIVLTEETTSIGEYTFNTYYETCIESISIYNRDCEIYDSQSTFHPSVTICGYTGSTAEAYATKYNRTFIPLDSSIITVVEPDLGEIEGLEYGENRVVWDEEITLKATALEGAKFEGWKVNGRLISLDRIYTDVCKNNMTIEAVFSEINSDEKITVTFLDKWGNLVANYNGTVDEVQAILRQSIPTTSDIVGYTFTGWNMTDEEIKNINCSTTVWAKYKKAQIGYTVDTNAQLNLPAGVTNGNIPYDTEVTVFDEKATAWKIGDCIVAYGNSYSFFVGANVTVTAVYESITATPTVTMLKVTNGGDKKFQFFATRSIPDGYKLVKAGFVFGRDMTDDELVLSNVGKKAQSGFTVKVGYCSLYGANQYALNYGVSAGSACAKAFATYRNLADNTIHTIYSEFIKAE